MSSSSPTLAGESAPLVVGSHPPFQVDQVDAEGSRVLRFDKVERVLHWVNATMVLVLLVTGATFYVGAFQGLVGNRALLRQVHVWTGIGLLVPWTLALAGRWRRGLVSDIHRLGRFTPADWRWLRHLGRAAVDRVGKFNAGQKLNAVFIAGALPVTLMTGSLMEWNKPFPDSWRTGATFVHDVMWLGLLIAIVGHIVKAAAEPESLSSMWRGWVPLSWARARRPRWHSEVTDGDH